MNDEILQLLIRVNADITLSNDIKEVMTARLQHCTSEEDFREIEDSLESYWLEVDPIIKAALARKTPEELREIDRLVTAMVTQTQKIAETSLQTHDAQEANSLISDII